MASGFSGAVQQVKGTTELVEEPGAVFEELVEDFAEALDAWSQKVKGALNGRPQKVLVNGLCNADQSNVSRWLSGRDQIWRGQAVLPGAVLTAGIVQVLQLHGCEAAALMHLADRVDQLRKQLMEHKGWRKKAGDYLQRGPGTETSVGTAAAAPQPPAGPLRKVNEANPAPAARTSGGGQLSALEIAPARTRDRNPLLLFTAPATALSRASRRLPFQRRWIALPAAIALVTLGTWYEQSRPQDQADGISASPSERPDASTSSSPSASLKKTGLPMAESGQTATRYACPKPLAYGDRSKCVSELQTRLVENGAVLNVDGIFGTKTRNAVEAFQTLADLPVSGVVDDRTKNAIDTSNARFRTWPREQVEQRIRKVFVEDPDRAVAVARCTSDLNPLLVQRRSLEGRLFRSYGVFQLWGPGTVQELGGSPKTALDPEWNIQAAHRIWAQTHDFRLWGCPPG